MSDNENAICALAARIKLGGLIMRGPDSDMLLDAAAEMRRLRSALEAAAINPMLHGTMKAPCSKPCCGCIDLQWVEDERAYMAVCNECGERHGWFKAVWDSPEDRRRLGGDRCGGVR